MVLVWHYVHCQIAPPDSPTISGLLHWTSLSWTGVDLFFVLSGFLIGGIVVDNQHRAGFFRSFYLRRAARILPVYVCLISLFIVARATLDRERFHWLFENDLPLVGYLTFTQNILMGLGETFGGHFVSVTWSLAVEEQFYLVVPLLLWIAGRYRQSWLAVLILVAPLLRWAFPGFHTFMNTPFRMDALLIGVMLATAVRSPSWLAWLARNKSWLWGVFLGLLLVMGYITHKGLAQASLAPTAVALFYAALILMSLVHRNQPATAILRTPLLTRLGFYSYGLYMYHQMTSGLMHGVFRKGIPIMRDASDVVVTLASLLIALALAILSRHTLESYFLTLGRGTKPIWTSGARPC